MCSRPSASMPTTPPCRCWPRARPAPAGLWTYVRDDRPFAGPDPPAAVFFYSRDRGGAHPEQHLAGYAGLMQADAYAGFNRLYEVGRKPGPIIEAACWAHARRKFFDLARINKAPIASRGGRAHRCAVCHRARDQRLAPQTARRRAHTSAAGRSSCELETWLREQRARVSKNSETGKAIDYSLKRWTALTALPRRWPTVHDQQRRRARAACHRGRAPQLDLRRL